MRFQAQVIDKEKNTRHIYNFGVDTEEEAREKVFKAFKYKVKRKYVENMILIRMI